MVSASRCNLLSRSLPNYQKEVLSYSDTVANEFHNLLVDLRTHHHHQYKVRRVLEEIRDLEADELPFKDQDGDEFSSLNLPEENQSRPLFDGDDDPLLDLGAFTEDPPPRAGGAGADKRETNLEDLRKRQEEKTQEPFRRVGDPFSFEEVAQQAKVKDLVLGGIEAELQALQNEVLNPRESQPASGAGREGVAQGGVKEEGVVQGGAKEEGVAQGGDEEGMAQVKESQDDEVDELLKLVDESEETDSQGAGGVGEGVDGQDKLASEWDNFSSFMPATRDNTKSPLSGWEQELMDPSTAAPSLDNILTPSIAQDSPAQNSVSSTSAPAHTANSSSPKPSASDPVAESSSEPHPPNGISTESVKGAAPTSEPDISVDELLGLGGRKTADKANSETANELLSSELQSLGISPPKSQSVPQESATPLTQGHAPYSGLTSVDPALFQLHAMQAQLPPTATSAVAGQTSPFRSPLGTTQCPPIFPTQGAMGMVMAPPKFGLVPPAMQGTGGATSLAPGAGAAKGAGGKEGGKDQKGTWMNFFAHLDPLVNEKA
jgi:hypothetical protein